MVASGLTGVFIFCCICSVVASLFSSDAEIQETSTPRATKKAILQQSPTNTTDSTMTYTPTISVTPTITETLFPTAESQATITPTIAETIEVTITSQPTTVVATSLSLASCVPSSTQRDLGTVVGIVDGDTISVSIDGQYFRVRYIGMDTPEQNEPYYYQATAANQALVYGKEVVLVKDVSETDRYGRLLRYVFVGNVFVNYELVKQGYASIATYPPDTACSSYFSTGQNQARSSQTGIWNPTPISPPTVVVSGSGTGTGAGVGTGSSSGSGNNEVSSNNDNGNCDPAYPTVCIPSPPPDLDCKDISYRRFQVLSPDPHNFDGDHDGIGCESG